MAKYRVVLSTNVTTTVVVEADSPEEAVEKAEEETDITLCHQCNREVEIGDEWSARDGRGEFYAAELDS